MTNPFPGRSPEGPDEPRVAATDVFWGLASAMIARTFTDRDGHEGDWPGSIELEVSQDWRSGAPDPRPPWERADFTLGDNDAPPGAIAGSPSWLQPNRALRGLRWDGSLATDPDGRLHLVATTFRHLLEEYRGVGPGGDDFRDARRPTGDGRARFVGTQREGIAPGVGWIRSLSVARGLALDAEGQPATHPSIRKGNPKMKVMMTPISAYGQQASAHSDLSRSPIALNLQEVAPALMTWREGTCQPAQTDTPMRWGKTEFEQSLEREINASKESGGLKFWRAPRPGQSLARVWTDLLNEGCRNLAVPAVTELINHCDVQATLHDAGAYSAESDDDRRGHAVFAASWRCLAAYLAARLDAVGRHMSPALMFARE